MASRGNYFELFGLPRSHQIDLTALDAAYERLSLEHHPDFFTTAGEAEQAEAQRITADLNEGYRVLRAEGERAAYLLGLLSGGHELDSTRLPDGFLQEMFMLQEEVDELGGDTEEAVKQPLKTQAQARLDTVRGETAGLFAQLNDGAANDGVAGHGAAPAEVMQPEALQEDLRTELLQAIQTHLNCGKYLERLLKRLQ